MSLARPLVALVYAGILVVAGVGHGAEATFTDATASLHTITAASPTVSTGSTTSGAPLSAPKPLTAPTSVAVGPTPATTSSSTVTVKTTAPSP